MFTTSGQSAAMTPALFHTTWQCPVRSSPSRRRGSSRRVMPAAMPTVPGRRYASSSLRPWRRPVSTRHIPAACKAPAVAGPMPAVIDTLRSARSTEVPPACWGRARCRLGRVLRLVLSWPGIASRCLHPPAPGAAIRDAPFRDHLAVAVLPSFVEPPAFGAAVRLGSLFFHGVPAPCRGGVRCEETPLSLRCRGAHVKCAATAAQQTPSREPMP